MGPLFTHPIAKTALAVLLALLVSCTSNRYESTSERNRLVPNGARGIPVEAEDTNSYWDGDGVSGRPRIIVDLEDQHAYFYKGNRLVGVSIISTGREGYNTRPGKFHIMDKDIDHASSIYGDYIDQWGEVVVENVENGKDPRPRGTIFRGAPMPISLGFTMVSGCMPAISRVTRLRTVVFGCRRAWRKNFSKMRRLARRWRLSKR